MTPTNIGSEKYIEYVAKARINSTNVVAPNSATNPHEGSAGLSPERSPCKTFACTSCAYLEPLGVGIGFATPSAVTPNITKVAPCNGSRRYSAADCR